MAEFAFHTLGLTLEEAEPPGYSLDLHTTASVGDLEHLVGWSDLAAGGCLRNTHQWTPLMYAVYYDHPPVIQLLVDWSGPARPDSGRARLMAAQNDLGRTAVALAAMCGHEDTLQLLLRLAFQTGLSHAHLEVADHYGRTPLYQAVLHGHETTTRLLLEAGSDPNGCIDHLRGYSVLMVAIEEGHERLAEMLVHHGAQADFVNISRESPRSVALKWGRKRLLQFLTRAQTLHRDGPSVLDGPAAVQKRLAELELSRSAPSIMSVTQFLREAGVDLKYAAMFAAKNIGWTELIAMNERELKTVVELMGPRKKISAALKKARTRSVVESDDPP